MQVVHRIAFRFGGDAEDREMLQRLGVPIPAGRFVWFDVHEGQPLWPQVEVWLASKGRGTTVTTRFTKRELDAAAWLTIKALLYHGYPQPADDWGYCDLSHDLSDYCAECGIGMRQKAPLRMRGEPKWGKRGLIQMYWVWDELFVTPEVWSSVFQPFGVGRREVLSRGGKVLQTVVQLVIDRETKLETADLLGSTCPGCARAKYDPTPRAFGPPLSGPPPSPVCKTSQWFGSGHHAFRNLVVAQEVRQALLAARVRGAGFRPLLASGVA